MTHIAIALQALQYRLSERSRDEHGGISVEWIALAAAVVVILGVVGSSDTVQDALTETFGNLVTNLPGAGGN